MRESNHIFCSEQCHKAYLSENKKKTDDTKKERSELVPGTPQVDAAYSESFGSIDLKNINMETFEAIQTVIETTDRELKNYLKDLELILESAGDKNLSELKGFLESKIDILDKSLDAFRKKAQETTKGLESIEEDLLKLHNFGLQSNQEIRSALKAGSEGLDGRLESIENGIAQTPSKLTKLFDALDNFSYSIEGSLSGLKGTLDDLTQRTSKEISSVKSGLEERLKGGFAAIESSIESSKELEKGLYKDNEEKVKGFLTEEKKNLEVLLSDYGKRFNLNLSANKERISQYISRGNVEIKDFLDYQRSELLRSVSKLSDNLASILARSDENLSKSGETISQRLITSLEERAREIDKNLDAFEEDLAEVLNENAGRIESFISSSEAESREMLSSLRNDFDEHLEHNRKLIRSDVSEVFSQTRAEIDDSIRDAGKNLENYAAQHREKIETFIRSGIENQRENLTRELVRNHGALNSILDSFRSSLEKNGAENTEALARTVRHQTAEIDRIVKAQIESMERKLSEASKSIEKLNKTTSNEFIAKLLSSQEFFTQQMKAHLEKRESLLLDKLAALVIANKGNIEEVLAKSSIDLDEKIKGIRSETSNLLKTEVTKSMDVFNLNLSSMLGEIKDNLKKKVRAIPSRFSLSSPMKIIISLILLFLIINPLAFYVNSKWLNKSFERKMADFAVNIGNTEVKSAVIESVKSEEPSRIKQVRTSLDLPDNYTTRNRKVTLRGKSKFGDFALLSVNGKWTSIDFIKNQSFSFDNVALARGKNRIEITAFDRNGDRSLTETRYLFFKRPSTKIYNLAYNIYRGDIRKPYISMTFDGGSNDKAASSILETLKAKDIRTTMFLSGVFIEKFPELTKRIVREGHEVGNHSFSHPHFIKNFGKSSQRTAYSKRSFQKELNKTAQLFFKTTGHKMAPYWRAPYGEINDQILSWAKDLGYTHVGWTTKEGKTMDTLDWVEMEESHLYRSAESIKKAILGFDNDERGGANGSIILMHLGTNRKNDHPYSKLSEIIEGMRSKGYSFKKVSELIRSYKHRSVAKNR